MNFAALCFFSVPCVQAASATWLNTGTTSGDWSEVSNWAGGVAPGATSGTTSADIASFTNAVGTYGTTGSPILIDAGRNIRSLEFLNSAGAYTVGTTNGNTLLLTASGQFLRGTLGTASNMITINAPLRLQGNYQFYNDHAQSGGFHIGGAIAGTATAGNFQTLTLNGYSAAVTNNVISGSITDGTNGGSLSVSLFGPSSWTLSGTSTITGGVIVNSSGANGTLRNTGNLTAGGNTFDTTFRLQNGTFDNQGQLTLTGPVNLDNNASRFVNSGTISQSGGNRLILLNQESSFANSGTINVHAIQIGDWGAGGGGAQTATFTNSTGGNITVDSLWVGRFKYGVFDNNGGNVTVASNLFIGKADNQRATVGGTNTFNLSGGTVTVNAGATFRLGAFNTATDTAGIFNLNGGTLATAVGLTGPSGTNNTGTFNFNGGTLRGTANNVTLLGTDLTAVNVQSGGGTVEVGTGLNNTISANLLDGGGGGGLTKTGVGTLTLSGANTYSGATTVSGGALILSASSSVASSAVLDVASSATLDVSAVTGGFVVGVSQTLRGNGAVIGNTTISGTLSPGNSTGTLTFANNLTLGGNSTSAFEINGFTAGLFDLVSGGPGSQTVTFDGALNLTFSNGFSTVGSLKIFDFDIYSGGFDNLSTTGLADGYSATFDSLSGAVNVVPEPSTYALLALAAVSLGAHVLRRRTR